MEMNKEEGALYVYRQLFEQTGNLIYLVGLGGAVIRRLVVAPHIEKMAQNYIHDFALKCMQKNDY